MRLTRAERRAAMAVLAMTATVVVSGIKLLKKHADYLAKQAAAKFREEPEAQEDQAAECDPADAETFSAAEKDMEDPSL